MSNNKLIPELRFPEYINEGEWEIKEVGEIFDVTRGYVLAMSSVQENQSDDNPYPVFSSQTKNNGLAGFYKEYLYEDAITWTTDGANAGSVFYHQNEQFSITNVCGLLQVTNPNVVSTKYVYYALGQEAKKHVSSGMGNPKLMSDAMSRIKIPVPPIEEQERIVAILDKLDALVNDISIGLPAEIAARRQQYAYYRDRLLKFEEAA